MTFVRSTLVAISLLPALAGGLAQQTAVKPVPAAPAINHPATSPPITRAPVPPQTARLSNVAPNYIIGASDVLSVTAYNYPNFSAAGLLVRPDGKITLSLVGDIPAAGLTPAQLAADITTRIKQFIIDPALTVNVNVLAVNSKQVYMIGEISRVGPINITPGMSILQAIATAGGLTPYANKKKIYILRGESGHQQKIPFDYKRAIDRGDMQGITLVPGDTIVVP
jgi:polysaccharide export outer membrane protein